MAHQDQQREDETPRRELRRLGWGLLVYVLVLLLIGVMVLRLAVTHRRFDRLTVMPVALPSGDTAVEAGQEPESLPDVRPVSGDSP
ncbi:MAG TPA: hypothetical protein VH879_08175 [Gemmatimonadales bacterium]